MNQQNFKVDKCLLQQRFASAIGSYNQHALVQKQMAKELRHLAQKYLNMEQDQLMEIGCGTGLLTQEIIQHFSIKSYVGNDLVESLEGDLRKLTAGKVGSFAFWGGDAEQLALPSCVSSIWSGATVQWMADLPRFLAKMNRLLSTDGFLVVSSFGPQNYVEIKQTAALGIPYRSADELQKLAAACFDLVAFEEWQQTLHFSSPLEVLRHMQSTGVNGLSKQAWTPQKYRQYAERYQCLKTEAGYPLTYHPYLMIFKKKQI